MFSEAYTVLVCNPFCARSDRPQVTSYGTTCAQEDLWDQTHSPLLFSCVTWRKDPAPALLPWSSTSAVLLTWERAAGSLPAQRKENLVLLTYPISSAFWGSPVSLGVAQLLNNKNEAPLLLKDNPLQPYIEYTKTALTTSLTTPTFFFYHRIAVFSKSWVQK